MNYDDNSGNSTTQNAYERGIEAAKTKMASAGASKVGNAASKALTASGHPVLGKGAQMIGNNIVKQNATSTTEEQGAEQNEMVNKAIEKGASTAAQAAGVPAPLANALGKGASNLTSGLGDAAEKAQNVQKTIKTAKLIWKLMPFIGGFIFIIFVAGLIATAINGVDQVVDKVINFGQSSSNFLTFNGFDTYSEEIKERIDQAAGDCSTCLFGSNLNNNSGLDKGMIYATIDNGVIVGPDVYDEDGEDSTTDGEELSKDDFSDGSSYVILDKLNSSAFYGMKLDLLGHSYEPGGMLYAIMGEEINVSCVNPEDVSASDNAKALGKYLYNGALTGMDIMLGKPKVWWENIAGNLQHTVEYASQDSNYLVSSARQFVFANFDENVSAAVIEDMNNMFSSIEACSSQYVYNADGTIKKDKSGKNVTKKAKLETQKINDYKQYYNYIAKVYTPTMYDSIWGGLTRDERIKLARDVWDDIVAARNDYYGFEGDGSFLSYQFDENGTLIATVTGTNGMTGGYMSNIPVGTAGTNWHQNRSPWSSYLLGSSTCVTSKGYPCNMGSIGCYITSISILMANSGTQINSTTFDPGVLARVLKENGAVNSSGSTTRFSWANLAPNFSYVKNAYTSGLVPPQIMQFLNEGLEVMVHVDGHHWVAVVGVQDGHVMIADPWDYGQTGAVRLDAWKYKNVDIVSGFRASDKH